MNRQQLTTWLTDHLKLAEPLDRPSDLDDPQQTAITATKKLALLGLGDGSLYGQALAVESPQQCAAVLMDCLAAISDSLQPESPQAVGMPDTVRRWIRDGLLEAVNVGEGTRPQYRITPDALRAFEARRPGRVVVPPAVQRRRKRRDDLPFTRYS